MSVSNVTTVPALEMRMPDPKITTKNQQKSSTYAYFHQRIAALGLDKVSALRHGLIANAQGAIMQLCRTYAGDPRQYFPQFGKKARKIEKMRRRKTFSDTNAEQLSELLHIVRHTPEQLAADPTLDRYKLWSKSYTGTPPLPLPNNVAIEHYQRHQKGGTVAFTEGYFKAVAAALIGLEMSSFSGNTLFKLDDTVKDYLLRRQPDDVILLLDGDALDLHGKKVELSSKRLQGFHNGMHHFAAAFFDWCKRQDLKIGLHIAIIRAGQPKGLDDLLEVASVEQKSIIKADFLSRHNSEYFRFVSLHKTTFKDKLRDLFYLRNHQQFYQQFGETIGKQPFQFNGFAYQYQPLPTRGTQLSLLEVGGDSNDSGTDVIYNVSTVGRVALPHFKLLDDPFAVEVPTTPITVEKYLGEARGKLQPLLHRHDRLAVESPTGSGKTTFFIKFCQRQRIKAIITVPTVNLARQLAQKHKLVALHGSVDPTKKVAALNAKIVVCTYDTLHHLDDLGGRWLLVDEAHNLINQYGTVRRHYQPFRAATVRSVVDSMERARKTVLLSGTMSPLLCQALNAHLVQVSRRVHPIIEVQHIAAAGAREQTAILLDELRRHDFRMDEINFVYYNSNTQLQLIKKELVNSGKLAAEDVVIITREMVNAGQHQIFNEIIRHERIKTPVKLILSTCLIAEGININNTNIGKVFTANVQCLDSFRQYVARFRNTDSLSVTCITPPERKLATAFRVSAEWELQDQLNCAQLQVQHHHRFRQQIIATYAPTELEFMPELLADYHPHGQLLNLIYTDPNGAKVDTLRILAAIRDRQLEDANNCYFFTRLVRYPEFRLVGSHGRTPRSDIQQRLREHRQLSREQKSNLFAQLQTDLLTRPELPIRAYYQRSQLMQNRHATTFIQITGKDFIADIEEIRDGIPSRNPLPAPNSAEILDYLEQYEAAFTHDWFVRPIRDYLRLHFAGVDPLTIAAEISHYDPQQFAEKWSAFQTTIELIIYDNKRLRKLLSPLHCLELKFLQRLKKRILHHHPTGKLTATDLREHTDTLLQYHRYRGDLDHPVVEQVTYLNPRQLERRLQSLFGVEVTVYNREREYAILTDYTKGTVDGKRWTMDGRSVGNFGKRNEMNVPFCQSTVAAIVHNPLKMLELYR